MDAWKYTNRFTDLHEIYIPAEGFIVNSSGQITACNDMPVESMYSIGETKEGDGILVPTKIQIPEHTAALVKAIHTLEQVITESRANVREKLFGANSQ